jgi:LAO/AO transport system kinase
VLASDDQEREFTADLALTQRTAKALSAVEAGGDGLLPDRRLPGQVVGLVGPPGVGKSSIISELVSRARDRGERVMVLAVDPSSPVTGGALLGDRIRLARHATDSGVFVRSFASRGHPGGLAGAVPAAVETALALGWDRVFVEPVGGGQNDIDVAACADRVVLVVSPESGDDVQALKAGILEVADIIAVNKADRPGAASFLRVLESQWGKSSGGLVLVSTIENTGIDELDDLTRAAFDHVANRKEAARLSAVLNDVVLEVRAVLQDAMVRDDVLALLASGRRRDAVRRLIKEVRHDGQ